MTNFINKTALCETIIMIIFLNLSTILVAQSSIAQGDARDNLVSIDWLNKNLKDNNLVILDASPGQIYTAKHIPGAINYDIFTYGVHELPVSEIEKRYQSWGISLGKKIIIYDQGGTIMATRLFYALDYYGFPTKDIFILDGGISKWQEAGLPLTSKAVNAPTKGSFTIRTLNKRVKADLPEFLEASGNLGNNVLVEALDPDWHFGALNFFGRPGHVPNAIMLPAEDFYNLDKTFKSTEEIKKLLAYLGINPEKNIYSHCGGGIAASVPYFALKYLLGYTNVKIFTGSQLEWASDQRELPFWTYDAPFLMRDADWLQGWGGKMMRMYGMSRVSFVDVRTSAIFSKGHLEYAQNILADVFKSNINNPGKMVEVLSTAGVNAANEAVIISGGGLTKEAALAFVVLEKLGQKKISIFMDPLDKWAELGFTVIKDTTAVDAKKVPHDNKPSVIYLVNLRNDIIITDPKSTHGIYPKIFIASGINMPSQTLDGKVVHIPYTILLKEDGTPKAAKDIWGVLTNAGIPRYAEIVCYSNEPGEAAINYFLLRLMGFPDIKVLVN